MQDTAPSTVQILIDTISRPLHVESPSLQVPPKVSSKVSMPKVRMSICQSQSSIRKTSLSGQGNCYKNCEQQGCVRDLWSVDADCQCNRTKQPRWSKPLCQELFFWQALLKQRCVTLLGDVFIFNALLAPCIETFVLYHRPGQTPVQGTSGLLTLKCKRQMASTRQAHGQAWLLCFR